MKPGDLVAPKRSEEFIFLRKKKSIEEEPVRWEASTVGMILGVIARDSRGLLMKILTPEEIGFCYDWEIKTLT